MNIQRKYMCFSLFTAHYYLSKKNFIETLYLDYPVSLQYYAGIITASNAPQTDTPPAIQHDHKTIYQTNILDISLNGYRIEWNNDAPALLKTGEYILVKEASHRQWRGGVIRWLKHSQNQAIKLGLEVLAQEMYPCAVRIQTNTQTNYYCPALIVKTQNLDEIKMTLILSNSSIFQPRQSIDIRLGKQEIKLYLLNAQLMTQSFLQFEFELCYKEHAVILEQFTASVTHH